MISKGPAKGEAVGAAGYRQLLGQKHRCPEVLKRHSAERIVALSKDIFAQRLIRL